MKKSTLIFLLLLGIPILIKDAAGGTYDCPLGMFYNGKACQQCSAGCSRCQNANTWECSACFDGFYLYKYMSDMTYCKLCSSSCKTCSDSSFCASCFDGQYLSGGKCITCPAGAICDGSSIVTCIKTGYIFWDSECIKDEDEEEQEPAKTNTVNSCPSRMKLSADGCCCINK